MNTETYLRKKLTEKKNVGKNHRNLLCFNFFYYQKSTERKNREELKRKERRKLKAK